MNQRGDKQFIGAHALTQFITNMDPMPRVVFVEGHRQSSMLVAYNLAEQLGDVGHGTVIFHMGEDAGRKESSPFTVVEMILQLEPKPLVFVPGGHLHDVVHSNGTLDQMMLWHTMCKKAEALHVLARLHPAYADEAGDPRGFNRWEDHTYVQLFRKQQSLDWVEMNWK